MTQAGYPPQFHTLHSACPPLKIDEARQRHQQGGQRKHKPEAGNEVGKDAEQDARNQRHAMHRFPLVLNCGTVNIRLTGSLKMKYFLWLIALTLLISTSACSKKTESAPQQQPAQTDAAPKSKYGKAMKSAEDVVSQREKTSKEVDEMMDE